MENDSIKTLRVSDKGQISIPNTIRQRMGIERGDNLVLFEINGKILLEKEQSVKEKMEDEYKDIMQLSQSSLGEVWNNPEDEIWNQYMEEK